MLNRRWVLLLAAGVGPLVGERAEGVTFRQEIVVTDGDIGYDTSLVIIPGSPPTLLGTGHAHVLGGAATPFAIIGNPTVVSGKAVDGFTADLSGATAFELAFRAPAGQHFQVDLPAGAEGGFEFNFHLVAPGGGGVTLLDDSRVSVLMDGVPLSGVNFGTNGVDPSGLAVLMEASQVNTETPTGLFTNSFSFQEITFRLDYEGVIDTSGALPQVLSPNSGALMFTSFVEGGTNTSQPRFIHVVPEPAGLAALAAAVPLVMGRRRG